MFVCTKTIGFETQNFASKWLYISAVKYELMRNIKNFCCCKYNVDCSLFFIIMQKLGWQNKSKPICPPKPIYSN